MPMQIKRTLYRVFPTLRWDLQCGLTDIGTAAYILGRVRVHQSSCRTTPYPSVGEVMIGRKMSNTCWICGIAVAPYSWNCPKGAHIKCPTCGEYLMSEQLAALMLEPPTNIRTNYIASAVIRELNESGTIPWVEDL